MLIFRSLFNKTSYYTVDKYGIRNYRNRHLALMSLAILYGVIAILAAVMLYFERSVIDSNITNYADAFWTLQMSSSTIGFGDHYPVTIAGRITVSITFYFGVAIVGFIGALLANKMLGFADTNVKNRELRQQNQTIIEQNQQLAQQLQQIQQQLEQQNKS